MKPWFLACWLAACGGGPVYSQTQTPYTLTGHIVSVTDGDTVVMQTAQTRARIRLASIDAPELGHDSGLTPRPGQPYGEAARKFLAGLVQGHVITARCFERDHYRRHVCDLLLDGKAGDKQTANRRLVEAGMAWANQEAGGKFLRDATLPEAQRQARTARRGLWREPRPVAPWQWRHQCWRRGQCG